MVSHTKINSGPEENSALRDNSATQNVNLSQACRILNNITDKLNEVYENLFMKHREEIAELAVEIARKILLQKVEKGDYEIEAIVKEALNNVPSRRDVEIHLNPKDAEQCQEELRNEQGCTLSGIKLIPDPDIGPAECLITSPKGTVHSFIEEHLEQIGEALKKA
ncbi:MAG: hypothetical protein JW715_15970 [Sedimentisphaerales bacterium]|nr:hypothetical protein [Sedimentisphaerales bacterium]